VLGVFSACRGSHRALIPQVEDYAHRRLLLFAGWDRFLASRFLEGNSIGGVTDYRSAGWRRPIVCAFGPRFRFYARGSHGILLFGRPSRPACRKANSGVPHVPKPAAGFAAGRWIQLVMRIPVSGGPCVCSLGADETDPGRRQGHGGLVSLFAVGGQCRLQRTPDRALL